MKSILIAIPGADLIAPIFVIAALTLAIPRTAQAFQETPGFVNITQSGVPVVDVRSTNGELYNDVANGGQIGTTVSGTCNISKQGKDHPIKSLTITADGWPGQMSNAVLGALPHNANDLPATGIKMDFPDGIHPTGVNYPATWKQKAIEACNMNLNYQIDAKGMGKSQVLAKQWELKSVPLDQLKATLACGNVDAPLGFIAVGGLYEATVAAKMNVRCQKYALDQVQANPKPPFTPSSSNDVKLKVGVSQAVLMLLPSTYQGACPTQLNVSGVIVTNGPTRVQYRLEDNKGQVSTVGSVDVDHTNTSYFSLKLTFGQQTSATPQNMLTGTTPGIGGGNGVNASGAIANQAPPANVHQGFYRLITISPNQVVSQPANFKVTCNPVAAQNKMVVPQTPQTRPTGGMLKGDKTKEKLRPVR